VADIKTSDNWGNIFNPSVLMVCQRHTGIFDAASLSKLLYRFMYLNRSFNYSSLLLSLAAKVGVNQIVFTPIFNSYFFGMQSFLSGDTLVEVWERVKRTVPTSFVNSCKVWPAVTAFSFTYIQPQYRALFAGELDGVRGDEAWMFTKILTGVIAVGWQSYLSWLNQIAADEEKARRGLQVEGS